MYALGKIIAREVKVWPNDRPTEGHADNPVIVNTYGNGSQQHVEIEVQRPGGMTSNAERCIHGESGPHATLGMEPVGDGHCSGPGAYWPYVVARIYLSKNNTARLIAQLADALEDA